MPKPDPNDISKFKPPVRSGVLQAAVEQSEPKEQSTVRAEKKPKKQIKPPKKKQAKQPRRNQINFYLTDEENEKLVEKAGMVPASKFVVAKLREAGLFD